MLNVVMASRFIDWAYACTDIRTVFCFMSIYPDGIGILM